jgi:hypothetical protein
MFKYAKMHVTLLLVGSVLASGQAWAQDAQGPSAAQAPSESAMVNLVRALVKQKALKPEDGDALIKQAETEAAQARGAKVQSAAATLPDAPAGAIRVPYIPETVRMQIKDELRAEVLQEAKAGSWASPDAAAPDWTRRVTLHGDVRVRSQSELYSKTNSNLIFDYARINAIGPVDIENPFVPLPTLNSRVDRWNRLRLRARLGADVVIAKGVKAAIQFATGDDNSPISTNASLAGGLGKRDIWLDQAYVKVEPNEWFNASFGRFPNPFASTDLVFDSDVNFDGVALEFNPGKMLSQNLDIALRGGAFPLDFGSADYPVLSFDKAKVPPKYLFSGEIEVKTKLADDIQIAASAGYHMYKNIQGGLSAPCDLAAGTPECTTDRLRPFFLRKGNTLSPLRNIIDDPRLTERPQFLGLTFGYNILDLNASLRLPINEDVGVKVSGNYVTNLAFRRSDICRNGQAGQPINNGGTQGNGRDFCGVTNPVDFVGGNKGYSGKILVGQERLKTAGQWNAFAGYRYLESDAVLDSLTDSDFHLGGTNAKGYFLGGQYGLFDGVSLGGRWMSANQVSGEPFAIDVLQIELQAAF